MSLLDPIMDVLERVKARAESAPVTRWGIVVTASPLTVALDGSINTAGTPVAAPAQSAIQGLAVGERVWCVEQHRRITVVQRRIVDTGWVDVVVNAGFAPQGGAVEKPQVRRRSGVTYFRGGFSSAGFSASSTHTPGYLPPGFAPQISSGLTPILSDGAHSASARVTPSGSLDVRTGTSVSGYYLFSGSWPND